jgi:hypothetical protein
MTSLTTLLSNPNYHRSDPLRAVAASRSAGVGRKVLIWNHKGSWARSVVSGKCLFWSEAKRRISECEKGAA